MGFGHVVGAREAPGDEGAGRVGRLDDLPQRPAPAQPGGQRAAECITGAQSVDDLDRQGGHPDFLTGGTGQHARRPLFDDGEPYAPLQQQVGGPVGVPGTDGDLGLVAVADGHGGQFQSPGVPGGGLRRVVPEGRAPVEVEHHVGLGRTLGRREQGGGP